MKRIFLFGNPTVGFTIVVSGTPEFPSIDGFCSKRMGPNIFKNILVTLIFVLIVIVVNIDTIFHYILGFSSFLRFSLAFLFLLPAGILTGLSFSFGMGIF